MSFTKKILHYFLSLNTVFLLSCQGDSEEDEALAVGNYYLSAVDISGHDVDFYPTKLGTYEIEADSTTSSLDITIEHEDDIDIVLSQIAGGSTVTYPLTSSPLTSHTFTVPLSEGNNFLQLALSGADYDVDTNYTFNIIKPSSSSQLLSLVAGDFTGETSASLAFEPAFDPDIFHYNIDVDYSTCAYAIGATPEYSESTMVFNGENLEPGSTRYQALTVGRNTHELVVTSENQNNSQTYSLTITREEGSYEETRAESRLLALNLTESDIAFTCGINTYIATIDLETEYLSFDFEPVAVGARVFWNEKELPLDETFILPIDDNLGVVTFTVESADQSTRQDYTVNYIRRTTNLVEVDTVEALIYALENARPNDDIRIAEGEYDLSLLDLETPYFFTDRSGTANEPIYLSPNGSDEEVILKNSTDSTSIFHLEGNYWKISNLIFEGGAQGITMNNASNNDLRSIKITGSALRGLWIQSGSHDNRISFSEFYDIGSGENPGDSAITIGEDSHSLPEDYQASTNNHIIQNNIYLNGTPVAVRIEENSDASFIEYNAFTEARDKYAVDHLSVIHVEGENTTIRYNNIIHTLNQPLTTVIHFETQDATEEENPTTEAWVYQNSAALAVSTTPLITADSHFQVYAIDNTPTASENNTTEDSNVGAFDFTQPYYHIQLASDERKCLGVEQIDDEDTDNDFYYMVIVECSESDTALWTFENDDGPHVAITNKAIEDQVLRTYSCFQDQCQEYTNASNKVFLDDDLGAYVQRWAIDTVGEHTVIRSKSALSYSFTINEDNVNYGNTIALLPYYGDASQHFTLIQYSGE